MEQTSIQGVEFKNLATHADRRGFFREILRVTDAVAADGAAQFSHSLMYQGVTKAWHWHRRQTDLWYVPLGVLRVGLHDRRANSPTRGRSMDLLMGEHQPAQLLRIPPGVLHGCQAVQGPAHLFYVTSRVYDPQDELRVPHDDPEIGFDWLASPPIA